MPCQQLIPFVAILFSLVSLHLAIAVRHDVAVVVYKLKRVSNGTTHELEKGSL